MEEKKYKVFSLVANAIIIIYWILNFLAILILESFSVRNSFQRFLYVILEMDMLIWHIFGLFSIITLLIKIIIVKKSIIIPQKFFYVDIITHIMFMLLGLFETVYMFAEAF